MKLVRVQYKDQKIEKKMKVHAESQYKDIHSDLCPENCDSKNISNKKYQRFLHKCLQEWLEKSNGEGMFYIASEGFIKNQVDKDLIT